MTLVFRSDRSGCLCGIPSQNNATRLRTESETGTKTTGYEASRTIE